MKTAYRNPYTNISVVLLEQSYIRQHECVYTLHLDMDNQDMSITSLDQSYEPGKCSR